MKFINRRVLFCAAYFVCAFAVSSLYLCGSYESIMPICIIYSMSSGMYDQTIKIATAEYVPTDMCVITKKCLFKYIKNFTTEKRKFSDKKNLIFFQISAQNIDCGYSLEPPRRGGSTEYPQSMFLSRNKKNNVCPVDPSFTI